MPYRPYSSRSSYSRSSHSRSRSRYTKQNTKQTKKPTKNYVKQTSAPTTTSSSGGWFLPAALGYIVGRNMSQTEASSEPVHIESSPKCQTLYDAMKSCIDRYGHNHDICKYDIDRFKQCINQ